MYKNFEEYIISLFKKNDFKSKEFQTALNLWGRPRMIEIWNKYKQKTQPLKEERTIQEEIDELFNK